VNKKSRLEWKFKDLPSLDAFQSRKEWEAACLNKVLETKGVLEILLTPKERHNLVIRAAAVESLASGKSYRQIGRELWVSPQTLSGLRKAVAENNYRSYASRHPQVRRPKTGRWFSESKMKSRRVLKHTAFGKPYFKKV